MKDQSKTKQVLIQELTSLRQRIAELERSESVRKPMEYALRKSKEELQWLFKSMINAFVLFESVFDDDGNFISCRFVYINDAYERITGVKNEEVTGKTVHEVWPETEPEWIKRYSEVAVTGASQKFELYHAPTKKLYYCNVYRPWDTKDHFCVIFEDITEHKQAEEALKEMEAQYRNLFENANEAIFVAQDGWLVFLNPMSTMMIGYSGKELMAKPFTEFIHPDDREMVINRHSRRMKGVEIPFPYSFQIIHKDGNSKWVEVNAVLINWKGKPATLNFLSDITDRKRAEEVMRERDIQFKKLSSWVPGMIYQFTKRPDGTYCMPFTTEAIKDIFGCSPQSTIMNSPADKKLSVASAWHR